MRCAVGLALFAACLPAATNPKAASEADAGLALARQGNYEAAIPHYRAALKLDPQMPGLSLNLGLAYLKLNRFTEAVPLFEQAAKSDPTSFQAHVLLGMS